MTTDKKTGKRMRVLIVTPGGTGNAGGISRMVSYFVRELDAQRSNLEYQILDSYGSAGKLAMPFYFARSCFLLLFSCAFHRVDLVHIHMAAHGSILRKLILVSIAKVFKVPVLLHVHGGRFPDVYSSLPKFLQASTRYLMHRADKVLVLGVYWRDFFVQTLFCDPDRIIVFPNAVPGPAALQPRTAQPVCKILFLGTLTENKGVQELLESVSDPRMARFSWLLRLAGAGDINYYRERARALGLGDNVDFLGPVGETEVSRLLAESEILVCSSKREALPMAILEAMSYGLCIVATPAGAIPEAVTDHWNGILVPFGESTAMASALIEIMENDSLRKDMQKNSRERYAERFQIATFVGRLLEMYAETASSAPRN